MNKDFQDRIDEFLLHADSMSEEDKARFLKEIGNDTEKREQFEFTKIVRDAVVSRGEKLKAMAVFEEERKTVRRRKTLFWVSGVAAAVVAGFFVVGSLVVGDSQDGTTRGGDDTFDKPALADSVAEDSVVADTGALYYDIR